MCIVGNSVMADSEPTFFLLNVACLVEKQQILIA
jgi:hypothetical protein